MHSIVLTFEIVSHCPYVSVLVELEKLFCLIVHFPHVYRIKMFALYKVITATVT